MNSVEFCHQRKGCNYDVKIHSLFKTFSLQHSKHVFFSKRFPCYRAFIVYWPQKKGLNSLHSEYDVPSKLTPLVWSPVTTFSPSNMRVGQNMRKIHTFCSICYQLLRKHFGLQLYCYHTRLCCNWDIYSIVGRAFLCNVNRNLCPVLSAIVS